MGCDIHCFIEKADKDYNNFWYQVKLYRVDPYYNDLEVVRAYDGRDYDLFSILAGVRGVYEPLVEPRGLPGNLSRDVERESEWFGSDAHTQTWYDLNELILLKRMYRDEEKYLGFVDFVDQILTYLDFAGEHIYGNVESGKYRVVIWFDS